MATHNTLTIIVYMFLLLLIVIIPDFLSYSVSLCYQIGQHFSLSY